MSKKVKAFTIMELLIVVVIVAIITAFAAPRYGKVIEKADERNMIANLKVLRATVDMYIQDGDPLPAGGDLATINNSYRLSILDTKATYVCETSGGRTNSCTATLNGWGLTFHDEHSNRRIHCRSDMTRCPSCPSQPGDCG